MAGLKFIQPQEIEVLLILPAIRRELAIEMKKLGFEQKKIAKILCVTEAAISQYIKNKRANKVNFSIEAKEAIAKSAKKIKNEKIMLYEIQNLLKLMKELKITCNLHKDLSTVAHNCVLCQKE